ncbi:hypothetical protein L6164_003015 [Bauhinia variegata]|uniref:Uncharacterized protein n=1 Tax=Bauhinia variegata TaxID=167791 RepID=A0ACB9Q002_BAUVA|nr:hypothetical protein L6164_003015 [Bauhinia variegata]
MVNFELAGKKDLIGQDLARQVKGDDDLAFQLIDGNSNFMDTALNDFATEVNLYECGRSYAVVAIMGPQSSGKSTLLNHLFQTKFREMDDSEGRSQTTQGIWLARCPNMKPLTIVMDIEGTDGSERGEDDTTFERRSALFALAVADVVLVNLWCHDIGREQAASKPLLKAVFQQVLLRFSNKPRKITLMFVVRDKTRSPEKKLKDRLISDVEKIWTSIKKPTENSNALLSSFFKVEVVFLPNYEEKEEEFKLKVKELKRRFVDSNAPGGLADSGEGKEPASGFAISARAIWKDIVDNKDLNLPAHKIVVATTRCQQISTELLDGFETDEVWCNLRKKAFDGFVSDFGERVNSILNHFLSKFDAEACYYDEAVTTEKRRELIENLLKHVKPVYRAVLNHLRLQHLKKFTEVFQKSSCEEDTFAMVADSCIGDCLFEFDKDCGAIRVDLANWDTLKARTKLHQDMKKFLAASGQQQSDSVIRRLYEPQVKRELSDSVGCLLCEEGDPTWSKIRKRLNIVMQSTITKLNTTLSKFGIDEEERMEKIQNLEEYAKQIVEAKAREESGRAGHHMIQKFLILFKSDRQWRNVGDIEEAAEASLYTPLDMLSGFAAIRLEAGDTDDIHHILSSEFRGSGNPNTRELLMASSWARVPPSRTLLTPSQCNSLWRTYLIEVRDAIQNAKKSIKKRRPRWMRVVLGVVEEFILKPIDWFINLF